ncbi:MAG: hypothetical protein A3E25_14800 [Burkholderiales bacterium RIFCSPHIGHO2_12_FULL_69_20]|nr:MAG: hypothetical protein A3E25_14800 [Burkholderiales bacterium RIFCSPHIGHO2_12_FULL_69_20]
MTSSRRHFLRATAGLAAAAAHPLGARFSLPLATQLAGLGALAASQARAASTNDGYKALVCLHLAGGNDSHNWIVPTDAGNRASYAAARGELAWAEGKLQGITSGTQASGRSFGMPLELGPLRDWYESGQCAVLANVGTLERPVTKADYKAGVGLPAKLFSHNDQAATWQSLQPEGAPSGWGGRMGDILMSANQHPVFTAVSASGNAVFLSGNSVTQYQVGTNGPVLINGAQAGWRAGSANTPGALRSLLAGSGSNAFEAEYLKVVQRSLSTSSLLQTALGNTALAALPTAPITLPNGSTLALNNDALAKQLRIVAQMIAAGPGLGMRRQVFMVSIGGFDSHSHQMRDQPLLMARVAQSVNWFLSALQGAGMLNNVVLFSTSDFGRTLASNGDGCDHGWGSHHFIAGGAVKGRQIFGTMPVTALGTADDLGSGRLLPSTSVTQYAATLGAWMGLSAGELRTVLPNLGSFSSANLGFV